jgi:hypothetical protein
MALMQEFPVEIVMRIFDYIDGPDLFRQCVLVCRHWYLLINQQRDWFFRSVIISEFSRDPGDGSCPAREMLAQRDASKQLLEATSKSFGIFGRFPNALPLPRQLSGDIVTIDVARSKVVRLALDFKMDESTSRSMYSVSFPPNFEYIYGDKRRSRTPCYSLFEDFEDIACRLHRFLMSGEYDVFDEWLIVNLDLICYQCPEIYKTLLAPLVFEDSELPPIRFGKRHLVAFYNSEFGFIDRWNVKLVGRALVIDCYPPGTAFIAIGAFQPDRVRCVLPSVAASMHLHYAKWMRKALVDTEINS